MICDIDSNSLNGYSGEVATQWSIPKVQLWMKLLFKLGATMFNVVGSSPTCSILERHSDGTNTDSSAE